MHLTLLHEYCVERLAKATVAASTITEKVYRTTIFSTRTMTSLALARCPFKYHFET